MTIRKNVVTTIDVIVRKLTEQTINCEFESYRVFHISSLMPKPCKAY